MQTNPCKVIFKIPGERSCVSGNESDTKASTAPVYIYTVLKSNRATPPEVWVLGMCGHVTTQAILSEQSDSCVQCLSS